MTYIIHVFIISGEVNNNVPVSETDCVISSGSDEFCENSTSADGSYIHKATTVSLAPGMYQMNIRQYL